MAPEIIIGKEYDCKVDIWSCGIMLQMMLTGAIPFRFNNSKEIFKLIRDYNPTKESFSWCKYLSPAAVDFLICCLRQDPKERFSAADLMKHEWLVCNAPSKELPKEHMSEILANLKQFSIKFRLEQAVYTFLAMNISSSEEEKYLRELFEKMDSSKDGKISKEEFINGMKKASKGNFTDFELDEIFSKTDADCSGCIDYIEFIRAAIDKKKLLSEENLHAAFNFFDKDHNGYITKEEIKTVFEKGKIVIDDLTLLAILGEIDSNSDKNVNC